ncbi:MAG: potassium channel family protein [Bacteroidales bacterium]
MDGKRRPVGFPRARFAVVFVLLLLLATGVVAFGSSADLRPRLDLAATAIVVITLVAATADRGRRRAAFVLGVLALASNGTSLSGFRPLGIEIGPLAAVLLLSYTTVLLVGTVMRSSRVTGDVLAGALAAYVMTGLAFAMVYGAIESFSPGAIQVDHALRPSLSDLVYFSFITLMTIGYGDVTPGVPATRAVAMLEGLSGITLTTVVLASLVANYLSGGRDDSADFNRP